MFFKQYYIFFNFELCHMSYKITTIKSIPVYLHVTFFLVFLLFAFIFSINEFPYGFRSIEPAAAKYFLACLTTVLFFITLLIHELAHSLLASSYGVQIQSITLFFFGGISVMENPKNKELVPPSKELKISLAGPLSNIVIGIVLLAINYFVFGSVSGVVDPESFVSIGSSVLLNSVPTVLFLIGLLNLVLGIFNLLPIYPMDGGRVLRAWLAQKQSYEEATKTTVSIGKNFAIIMAIISIFTLHWWLALLSLFLYISAAEEGKMLKTTSLLEKIFVQEIMTTTVDTVEESMTLNDFIQFVFQKKHPGYPVVKNGNVIGMVTVDDARFVNEAERYAFTIKDIMKESVSIDKEATGLEALNEMGLKKVGRLIVLDEEKNMVGILSRADLMTAIYLKESFKKD